jgi:hypothetical protein
VESRLAPSANVPITTNPGVQQMPSIAVDPLNSRHEVVAYMDYSLLATGYAGIGAAVTEDGGVTWTHSSIPLPAPVNQGAATPTVQFNAQGQVFVSFAAATFLGELPRITDPPGGDQRALGFSSNNGVFVVRSDDGGLTWNQPVAVASHVYDGSNSVPFEIKPDLAIDRFATGPGGQPNPYYGNLYVSWSRYYPAGQFPGEPTATGGSDIMLAVSRDDGQTWEIELEPQAGTGVPVSVISGNGGYGNTGTDAIAGAGHYNWSQVTVGAAGAIYVVQATGEPTVFSSTDGGKNFTKPNQLTGLNFPFFVNTTSNVFSFIPAPTLTNDQFRTQKIQDIAADATRPGYIYVVETAAILSDNGSTLDPGVIIFSRSTDFGVTWQITFQVGPYAGARLLNDDNFGQLPSGPPVDVIDGQAFPQLAVDAQGNIGVIWYDTRRDPADTRLDVYGTTSTDGGATWSANFRITDQSFNPNLGAFTDATGQTDDYLGDRIGVAMGGGTASAVWTDTRTGSQQIDFSSFPIDPAPAPPTNRFGPSNTPALATELGVVLTRSVPKLTIGNGDQEWFGLKAAATGTLTISAALVTPGDAVRLDLFDAGGTTLLAAGTAVQDASGRVTGQSLTFRGQSGHVYLVEVLPGPAAGEAAPAVYTLNMQSLTADLGDEVYGVESGSLVPGANCYYALSTPATGSLEVVLTPETDATGNFQLELLDPSNLTVLASGQQAGTAQFADLTVTPGQAVYIHVYGAAAAQGDFSLRFTNLDQYDVADDRTLFFPTGGNPSQVALADLTGSGRLDVVVDYADQNFVSVLLSNGDGTFQAPRDYAVGPYLPAGGNSSLQGLVDDRREMVVADFTRSGVPDIAVLNYQSDTISLLLGNGDGTLQPQRIIGLGSLVDPYALAAGDLTGSGIMDLVVVSSTNGDPTTGDQHGEVLLGRGDGTLGPPIPFTVPNDNGYPTNIIQIADLNHDRKPDLVYEGLNNSYVLLGNGNGTFQSAIPTGMGIQGGLALTDLTGDGNLDVVMSRPLLPSTNIEYALGNGDGTFGPIEYLDAGAAPVALAVADLGSQVTLPDGSTVLGPPDGIPDLIVADNGLIQNLDNGPPEIVVLPGLVNTQGQFAGFGAPISYAPAYSPLDLKVADLTGDGSIDVVVAETGGIEVIYPKPLVLTTNTTPQAARNLGVVVHAAEPAQTIVPGREDAYYSLNVPTEAARGAGNEILDFSGFFQGQGGSGLSMEVTNAAGHVLGSGERFQIDAPQGAVLLLHVFGVAEAGGTRGTGAYTLDVDVLPRVVSIAAQALLPGAGAAPGGPTTSLVITLQGDRLDPGAVENAANYSVTWLGPDGEQVIPLASGQSVVYDPSSNVDVASGVTYPTAVRQTVTLLFDQPLPAGSYQIDLNPAIQAAPFSNDESAALSASPVIPGHPVVSLVSGTIVAGDKQIVPGLVSASAAFGNLAVWSSGTPFLTQLHDDLAALLEAQLAAHGDRPAISANIDSQIVARFNPALGAPDERPIAVLVIWLDPVPLDLYGGKSQMSYNPNTNSYVSTFNTGFVSVAGNVELLVIPFTPTGVQSYTLGVTPAPGSRGGIDYFGTAGDQGQSLTAALRGGQTQFFLSFGSDTPVESLERASNSVDALDTQLATARLVEVSSTFSASTVVTLITPLSIPSEPVGPAGGGQTAEALAATVASQSSGSPGALGQATQAAPPSPATQPGGLGGASSQPAAVATSAQSLIDPVETAAKLLRRLLPVLQEWLRSLLGAMGAGAAAAVQPAAPGRAQAQPERPGPALETVALPPLGAEGAATEVASAPVRIDAPALLGHDRRNGRVRVEAAREQTDPLVLVGLLGFIMLRGGECPKRAGRRVTVLSRVAACPLTRPSGTLSPLGRGQSRRSSRFSCSTRPSGERG